MAITAVTVHDQELLKSLAILRNVVNSREIITAERKAAKMLIDRGYERLLATLIGNSDYLINSFTYKLRYGTQSMSGVRVGFKRPGGNVAHLVDLGTEERYTKTGAYRGRIKGGHFWTNTKEQYAPIAMQDMMDAIANAVNKINSRS